jgi:hypothetical protein
VSGRARAHPARPARRRRRTYQFERLEDRMLMTGNPGGGPEFVENLPDPNEPDPNPIVVQATLDAWDDYLQVRLDGVGQSLNVLGNDSGPNGRSSLRVTSVTATKLGGQLTISADGRSLIYTPPALPSQYDPLYRGLSAGSDSFAYVVEDDAGRISKANVTVNLFTPLRGPQNDYLHVLEDETNFPLDVLANDNEFAGGTIVAVGESTRGGSVTISTDGKKLLYTPPAAFKGQDYFTYTVEDSAGHAATVDVRISVDSRFVANYDSFEVDVDRPLVELDVLANDYSRGNAEPPRIVAVDLPENFVGSLTISADGKKLLYRPAAGFIGDVSFDYTVRYGPAEHHTVSANASIAVIDPFLAVDNWFMVDPGSAATTFDVLANDPVLSRYGIASYGSQLRITAVSAGSAAGSIEIASDGRQVRYTPAAGFTGDETFEYTVVDETGHVDTAQVTVHVAFEEADPFDLPRFRTPAELAQFLIDEAVQRYASNFSRQYRSFVPGGGAGGSSGGEGVPAYYDTYNLESITRIMAGGVMLAADYSTTNVQHEGIDEADVVETDGNFIYSLTQGRLVIVDVRDVTHPQLVSITQFDSSLTEMYLQGDRLTLISRGGYSSPGMVVVLDVSDRGEPELSERTVIDGQIVDTRAIGDRVYVVTQQYLDYPGPTSHVVAEIPAEDGSGVWQVTAYETLDEYIARVGETLAELLPQFRTYNAAGELIASGPLSDVHQIHKPISATDCVLASLVTFDVSDDAVGPITSTGLFTNSSDNIYVSPSAMYVLRTDTPMVGGSNGTRVLKFAFADDGTTSLEAAGNVIGKILNQFSLDEHEGLLRIVTTETTYDAAWRTRRTQNHLFVLEQVGTELRVAGAIENLAPTEEVKSVRFVGDRAYVVTFRVVDPLFAIDLSMPTAPRVAGAIKIPGFSNYLHPVGEDYILGFGRDANEITGELGAAQVSLFFVGDLDHPQLVDRMTLSGADWFSSEAFFDHHAIAYFAEQQVLSIPISWQETTEMDADGDGTIDRWNSQQRSAAFVFQLDVDGANVGMEFAGRIDHDSTVRRSVRIGDALITISNDYVKIHDLDHPDVEIAEVYLGNLPRDDQFEVLEDSGATELDVRANDRPGDSGEPLSIASVTQPVRPYGYYLWDGSWGSTSVGTVEITADRQSVVFTPAENFFGTATFTYTVFDEVRGMQTATVTIVVENVPDAPDAIDDERQVEAGAQRAALYVLANDVDVDQDGTFSSWYITDLVLSDPSLLTMPTARLQTADAAIVADVSAFAVRTTAMLGDVAYWGRFSNGLKITSVTVADSGGTVEIDEHGQFLYYTPAEGFEGIETFTYTIEAPNGLTDTATVSVHVGPVSAAAWAAALARIGSVPGSESVGPIQTNAATTTDSPPTYMSVDRQPFAAMPLKSQALSPTLGDQQLTARLSTNRLNLTLALDARQDAHRSRMPAEDAFADLSSGPVLQGGMCDDLSDDLVAELAPGLLRLA